MIQRAREELDRERRNLLRRRPNYEVKEKLTKTTYTRAKSKDRGGSFLAPDDLKLLIPKLEQKIVLVHLSFKMKVVMMV